MDRGASEPESSRAFLFPSSSGTAFSVGNYLKRYLKPLAEKADVHGVTHQAFRRTSSTHIQNHASVKDMQRHLRHTDPQTTLKHYAKVIPKACVRLSPPWMQKSLERLRERSGTSSSSDSYTGEC